MKKGRLCLLIDHNLNDQEKFEDALEVTGLEVECCTLENTKDFHKVLTVKSFTPEYIFYNPEIPDFNIHTLVSGLKSRFSYNIPIIIYSKSFYIHDLQEFKSLGVKTFITKPIEHRALVTKLKYIFKIKKG